MKTSEKVGFLKPNNEIDYMPYYDMFEYCKMKVEQYISLNSCNRIKFENFKSEYTYFPPYLDFVIFEMGYIQIQPFLQEGYYGYGLDDSYYITQADSPDYQKIRNSNGAFYFLRGNDSNYQINAGSIVENGMIDINGNILHLFSDGDIDSNAWGHPGLSCMVINQYISRYKQIYEAYKQYLDETNVNMYTMFLVSNLAFGQVSTRRSHSCVILNPNCFTKSQIQSAYAIQEYYGSSILPCGSKDEQNKKNTQTLIYTIWGDKIEN